MKRGGPLGRRTPLRSMSTLQRVSPLQGGGPLTRRTPIQAVSAKRASAQGKPARPRNTGPDRTTRDLCLEREDFSCAGCGRQILTGPRSLQHRKARGAGGTSDPAANRPSNLIWLCGAATTPGSCHLAAEQRTAETRTAGLWVSSWQDPADVPVVHAVHGLVLLNDGGGVEPFRRAA